MLSSMGDTIILPALTFPVKLRGDRGFCVASIRHKCPQFYHVTDLHKNIDHTVTHLEDHPSCKKARCLISRTEELKS